MLVYLGLSRFLFLCPLSISKRMSSASRRPYHGTVRGLRFVGQWYDVGEETLHCHTHGAKIRERLKLCLPIDTEPEGTELEKLLYPPVNDCESQRT